MSEFMKSQEDPNLQNWNRKDAGAFDLEVELLRCMVQGCPRIPGICGRECCDKLERETEKNNVRSKLEGWLEVELIEALLRDINGIHGCTYSKKSDAATLISSMSPRRYKIRARAAAAAWGVSS